MIRLCFSPVKEDVLALVIVVHPLVLKFHLNHCQKQQNRKQNPAICGSRTHFIVTEAALIMRSTITIVEPSGPPSGVMIIICVNSWKELIKLIIKTKKSVGVSNGNVILVNCLILPGAIDCRRIVVFLIDSLKARHQHKAKVPHILPDRGKNDCGHCPL